MDKIKNISLGGFSFLIEENAYTALSQYLAQVRQHLLHNPDRDEIIFDVEQRMAELLKDRIANREVVMHHDVLYLIEVLGKPEQYVEEEEQQQPDSSADATSQTFSATKPLYRDIDDRKIGGVLSGIAHYFSINPTKLRIAFAILFALFFTSGGRWFLPFHSVSFVMLVLYLIFWIVVPAAVTTAQKLEMQGTAVTLDSLATYKANTPPAPPSNSTAPKRGSLLLTIIFAVLALPLLFTLVAVIMGIFGVTSASGLSLLLLNDYLPFLISNYTQRIMLYGSVFLLLLVPISLLILVIVRLSYKRFRSTRLWGILTLAAFIGGLIGLSISGTTIAKSFLVQNHIQRRISIPTTADTLYLSIKTKHGNSLALTVDTDTLLVQHESYLRNILPTNEAEPYLLCNQTAMGKTHSQAAQNAKNIRIPLDIKDNHIAIPDYYEIIRGNTYRGQSVHYQLYLPVGKYIKGAKKGEQPNIKSPHLLLEDGLYQMTKDSLRLVNKK